MYFRDLNFIRDEYYNMYKIIYCNFNTLIPHSHDCYFTFTVLGAQVKKRFSVLNV